MSLQKKSGKINVNSLRKVDQNVIFGDFVEQITEMSPSRINEILQKAQDFSKDVDHAFVNDTMRLLETLSKRH